MVVKMTKYYCEKKCNELIVPTEKIKDLFQNKYGILKNINVIPTGIDIDKFQKNDDMTKQIKELKKKYNITDKDFVIGSVGRIAVEKSFDKLLINTKKLLNENNDIKLLIVGDGPDIDNLKDLTKKLDITNNVIFTGKVDYSLIPAYYNLFDVVATFSKSETQGLTIIEGLAASKPTICINDDSFKAMITDNYNGYLFNSDEEFKDDILKLLTNKELYKQMSNNARNSTYKYSKEVFASEVLKVYHNAIANYKK